MKRDDFGLDWPGPDVGLADQNPPTMRVEPVPRTVTYRWQLTHALIVIEVGADGQVLVNGEVVAPLS